MLPGKISRKVHGGQVYIYRIIVYVLFEVEEELRFVIGCAFAALKTYGVRRRYRARRYGKINSRTRVGFVIFVAVVVFVGRYCAAELSARTAESAAYKKVFLNGGITVIEIVFKTISVNARAVAVIL